MEGEIARSRAWRPLTAKLLTAQVRGIIQYSTVCTVGVISGGDNNITEVMYYIIMRAFLYMYFTDNNSR